MENLKSAHFEVTPCGEAHQHAFHVTTIRGGTQKTVQRSFADFEWLDSTVRRVLTPGCIMPPIPSAALMGAFEEKKRHALSVMFLRRFAHAVASHPELHDHRVIVVWFLGGADALAEVRALTDSSRDLERDRMFTALGSTVKGLRHASVSSSGSHKDTMANASRTSRAA